MTKITHEQWTDEVSALLAPAMAADPLATIETVRQRVEQGAQSLFVVREEGEIVGAFTLALEEAELGRELVVPVAGSKSARPLSRDVVPFIAARAEEMGAAFVRVHVPSAIWARALSRYGWKAGEMVMRKGVGHGRA